MRTPEFSSWLAPHLGQHLALKRACGFDYRVQANILARFDRHLVEQRARRPLSSRLLQDYLATLSRLCPRTRDLNVSVVWQALGHASRQGAPIERLPARPRSTPSSFRWREPFVLSPSQAQRLFAATRKLTIDLPFVQATHTCLLGLLYTTGLRIGEALKLDVGDLDRGGQTLFVRAGKFKKDRLLPLPASNVTALACYLDDPLRPVASEPDAPFFVSRQRGRLSYIAAREMLLRAARIAGFEAETDHRIRPHDLRHTFAVHRVLAWYREGRDVNVLLPALSAYMGHVSPAHTYTYLRAAELLYGEVTRRFERAANEAIDGRKA